MADTASYAGVLKTKVIDPARAAARKQAGRRKAKRKQQKKYLDS
jgi:hypothetical protein